MGARRGDGRLTSSHTRVISPMALFSSPRWHVTQIPASPTSIVAPSSRRLSTLKRWCGVCHFPSLPFCANGHVSTFPRAGRLSHKMKTTV